MVNSYTVFYSSLTDSVITDLFECAAMKLTKSWYTASQKDRGSKLEIILSGIGRGFMSRESAVGIAPRLRAGRSRLLIPAEAIDFFLLQIFQTSCEAYWGLLRPIQSPFHYVPVFFSGGMATGAWCGKQVYLSKKKKSLSIAYVENQ